jgi:hypothetical protein
VILSFIDETNADVLSELIERAQAVGIGGTTLRLVVFSLVGKGSVLKCLESCTKEVISKFHRLITNAP